METDSLRAELTTLGCDSAQGFGISPALSADALERLVTSAELAGTGAPGGRRPGVLPAPSG
ncbi:hypothetical protein ACI79D_00725 [Geodermatophilus sp. SYSU D00708]